MSEVADKFANSKMFKGSDDEEDSEKDSSEEEKEVEQESKKEARMEDEAKKQKPKESQKVGTTPPPKKTLSTPETKPKQTARMTKPASKKVEEPKEDVNEGKGKGVSGSKIFFYVCGEAEKVSSRFDIKNLKANHLEMEVKRKNMKEFKLSYRPGGKKKGFYVEDFISSGFKQHIPEFTKRIKDSTIFKENWTDGEQETILDWIDRLGKYDDEDLERFFLDFTPKRTAPRVKDKESGSEVEEEPKKRRGKKKRKEEVVEEDDPLEPETKVSAPKKKKKQEKKEVVVDTKKKNSPEKSELSEDKKQILNYWMSRIDNLKNDVRYFIDKIDERDSYKDKMKLIGEHVTMFPLYSSK